jgi:hypothetical protein
MPAIHWHSGIGDQTRNVTAMGGSTQREVSHEGQSIAIMCIVLDEQGFWYGRDAGKGGIASSTVKATLWARSRASRNLETGRGLQSSTIAQQPS